MKPIPIHAARSIAEQYCYDQVVIVARRVGEGGGEHVTTYGRDEANCDVAARIGRHLKFSVMQWKAEREEAEIVAAAAAIANARAGRGGHPPVSNVLEVLQKVRPELYDEVMEDARAALAAAAKAQ